MEYGGKNQFLTQAFFFSAGRAKEKDDNRVSRPHRSYRPLLQFFLRKFHSPSGTLQNYPGYSWHKMENNGIKAR